jgi:hypothetical protein
VPQSR